MKKLTLLAILIAAMFLLAGCGGGDEAETTAKDEAPATEATEAVAEHPKAEHPASAEHPAAGTETAAVHDCSGACGMKDVPEDKLTEVGGKYYCAGCVGKAEEAAKGATGSG